MRALVKSILSIVLRSRTFKWFRPILCLAEVAATSFPGPLLFPSPGAREEGGREEERPWERG